MNEEQLTCLKNTAEALKALIEAVDQAEDAGSYVAGIDRAVEKIRVTAGKVVSEWRAGRDQHTDHITTSGGLPHIRRIFPS